MKYLFENQFHGKDSSRLFPLVPISRNNRGCVIICFEYIYWRSGENRVFVKVKSTPVGVMSRPCRILVLSDETPSSLNNRRYVNNKFHEILGLGPNVIGAKNVPSRLPKTGKSSPRLGCRTQAPNVKRVLRQRVQIIFLRHNPHRKLN